jgi:flagellar motor protein MotB
MAKRMRGRVLGATCAVVSGLVSFAVRAEVPATSGAAHTRDISTAVPIAPGVNFVLAVHNSPKQNASNLEGLIQGDYEVVVSLGEVSEQGVTQIAHIDGFDAQGKHQRGSIPRQVTKRDLEGSREQVLGFYSDDPKVIAGTTALGPSLAITRDLRQAGKAEYSFRNFASQGKASGTLTLAKPARVEFPVLINGARTTLEAIHAIGHLEAGGRRRPFETYILDHPRYPITLRVAWGPPDGGFPFEPHFAREVVRIDHGRKISIAEAMEKDCRVEVPGLYFDFNLATLKPQSEGALQEIAKAFAQAPRRALRIEGHTDNIGTDRYNDDLSKRRAATVKQALVDDYDVSASMLTTMGYGESKPIETNETLAGRARNRRVELVCAQGK